LDGSDNLIQFHLEPQQTPEPAPYPAAQAMPDWLKKMQPQMEYSGVGTIPMLKQCMPFVDAVSSGYVIPLRGPVRFAMHEGGKLEIANLDFPATGLAVDTQSELPYHGAPFTGMFVVKFINKWIVKTPPGYSCLFMPMLNEFAMPFRVFTGVIETDTYYRSVNLPALCQMPPGTQVTLERGTPLAQIIPFKRETWRMEMGAADSARAAAAEQASHTPYNYRDKIWAKKEFR
jgi:hypothetical protein